MNETIRVLHVEDEIDFAEMTAEFLESEEARLTVETVTSPTTALDKIESDGFDCVVSDYAMPEMNGIELLQSVREEHPDLPFILFTGKGSEEVASDAISAGVTDYLQKELSTDQFTLLANRIVNAVEAAAAEAERERLLNAVETSREGISILNDDGEFIYVNDKYADLYGYHKEELLGEHWELIYPDSEVEQISEDILPRVDEAGYWRGETTGLRSDGSTFIEDHTLARTESGELVCTVRDISTQEEERAALMRFREVLDELPDSIWVYDSEKTCVFANQAAVEITGIPREAYVGESLETLLSQSTLVDEDPEDIIRQVEDLLDDSRLEEELRNTHQFQIDGEEMYVDARTGRIEDAEGNAVGVVTVFRDITERVESVLELQERNETITSLHTIATDLDNCETEQQVYDHIIHAVEDILEFDIAIVDRAEGDVLMPQAVSSQLDAAQYYDETPIQANDNLGARAYRTGEATIVNDLSTRDVTPADPTFKAALTVPIGEFGVFQAVSKSKNEYDNIDLELTEMLVSHAESRLSTLKRLRELEQQTEELERQNARLDRFVKVVSHDLRNPVNVAKGRVDLLQDDVNSEHVRAIAEAVGRMDKMINKLLELAKAGEDIGEYEPVDLNDLVASCVRIVQPEDSTVTIQTEQTILADRSRLQQLVENLLRNAVEHSDNEVSITIGDIEDGFYIEDDGPGISEQKREQIFEPGYTTANGGTGLGLNIVKEIAEAHGWDVSLTESDDGGARFEFTNVKTR